MINKYINTRVKNIILGTIKNMNLIRGPYLLLKIIIIIIKINLKCFKSYKMMYIDLLYVNSN